MSIESPTIEKKKVTKRALKEPGKYKVIVCNDDTTPMDFVVAMLISVFNKAPQEATKLTIKVHVEGSAVAGVYSNEIAEQKSSESIRLSRSNGYHLVTKVEAE
jgi:ATP-dependent Clp protease adaptor protein ClpS